MAKGSREELPELGVGVTYMPTLEPLLRQYPSLVDVIEIEPQTLWRSNGSTEKQYSAFDGVFEKIAELPFRKLVHNVGIPVGGTIKADQHSLSLLAKNVEILKSPWASDHLSFNATSEFHTGFFLPPLQNPDSVRNAVDAIRRLQDAVGVPVAIETGVNYFRSRTGEIPDGHFVAEISERSGCGILLDLHNIYCNQVNGRQSIEQFLGQISLSKVWEVHLAGGLELDGYWLDAHSGAIPVPLFELCQGIFPQLTNLKAVVFEIFPSFVAEVGLGVVRRQLELVRTLWDMRSTSRRLPTRVGSPRLEFVGTVDQTCTASQWEEALGAMVIGRTCTTNISLELATDPAVNLVRGLIHEFRGSMIVSLLRMTSTLLMLCLGTDGFTLILKDYWSKNSPQQFASDEAQAFAKYLIVLDLAVPHLIKTLEFEHAAIQSFIAGKAFVVQFDFDPFPLFRALSNGRLPDILGKQGNFEIELNPSSLDGEIDLDAIQVHL